MNKPATKKKVKNKGGRPPAFKQEYVDQVYKLCLLGATDKELGDFFLVKEQTINNWKKKYPEFFESLKKGKMMADADVAKSLFERAKGYEHESVHISNYQGEITKTTLTKHYPPDTGAAMAWLKNRQPEKWRDKVEVDNTLLTIGKDGETTGIKPGLTEDEARAMFLKIKHEN